MRRKKEVLAEKMCGSAGVVIHLLCSVLRKDRVRVCACSRGGRCKVKVAGCLVGKKLATFFSCDVR